MKSYFLFLVLVFGWGFPLHGRTLVLNGPLLETQSLQAFQDFYRDSTTKLALPDVMQEGRVTWRPLPRPMLGVSSDVLWIRVQLRNETAQTIPILIEDRWPQTNFLDFFVVHNDQLIETQKSGDHIPLGERHTPYRYPVFDLELPPGDSTIYLRYESNDLLSSRLFLSSESSFNQTRELEKLVFGLLLGILLIMPLYNSMLYFMLKDSSYLYYTIYGLLYVVFQVGINGLAFQYVLDYSWVNDELSMFAGMLCVFFVYRFVSNFFDLKKQMRGVARLMAICENFALAVAVLALIHVGSAILIGLACNVVMVSWLVYTSWVMARRRYKPASFFLVAWLLFVVGDSFSVIGYLGFMEDGFLTQFGMLAGSAVEVVLVSIAMGYKFEEIRQALIVSEVEKSKLIGSVESARIIQESLVSKTIRSATLEAASYYRSAEQTGGDWFSIIDRPEQNFAVFALGDVTGHGLSSSMMTAFACGALEASVHNLDWSPAGMERSLGRLAETFNQMLFRTASSNDRMMTMTVFAIDLLTMRGFYVNCGHHASYILSKDRLKPVFRKSSILGFAQENSAFPVLPFQVAVGDTLILHSDGLVENTGPTGRPFAMHRVGEILHHDRRPGDNLQALIEGAEAVWKGTRPADDVTVLMIRINAPAQDRKPVLEQTA